MRTRDAWRRSPRLYRLPDSCPFNHPRTDKAETPMAQLNTHALDTGDTFPSVTFKLLDGNSVTLPEYGSGGWRVLLVYRGNW